MTTQRIALVGAGLAGCECALQLARRGFAVTLFEQKPEAYSPAHSMPQLAELVCSNSLRSDELASGVGLIKQELRELGSALMAVADATRVPAGKALAVDRELFAGKVTELVEAEPNITLVRKAIADLDDPALEGFERVVISAGPLASESLSASIARAVGAEHLYFYDAIAPIVAADSIDMGIAFWGSRYGEPGEGDYLNCPMNEDEYKAFYQGLLDGEKVASREFEQEKHFEGCMPWRRLPRAWREDAGLRSAQACGLHRSAHRAASFRVASASPREWEQDDVQSGGLPDQADLSRAGSLLPQGAGP